ncbi:inner membrane protein YiaA [Microbacterium sp.]|uniref:inner membrane protein YiaA n=1 Tax=Microbacterium sp. TaxID=51671 RepID=UPI0039E3D296
MYEPEAQRDQFGKPTPAFVGAAWVALALAVVVYFVSLWRAEMDPFEKGFFLGAFFFGLVSAVGLQKSVRDRHEGVPVTTIYLGVSWLGLGISIAMLAWGLWNSPLLPSENGLYGMTFAMAVFATVVVQKNVRDSLAFKARHPELYGADAIEARRQTAEA